MVLSFLLVPPMEEVFGDALGLFGVEIEEDDGYVYYGGLKLKVVPKV